MPEGYFTRLGGLLGIVELAGMLFREAPPPLMLPFDFCRLLFSIKLTYNLVYNS